MTVRSSLNAAYAHLTDGLDAEMRGSVDRALARPLRQTPEEAQAWERREAGLANQQAMRRLNIRPRGGRV